MKVLGKLIFSKASTGSGFLTLMLKEHWFVSHRGGGGGGRGGGLGRRVRLSKFARFLAALDDLLVFVVMKLFCPIRFHCIAGRTYLKWNVELRPETRKSGLAESSRKLPATKSTERGSVPVLSDSGDDSSIAVVPSERVVLKRG